jgi:hypothetical protein
MANMLGFANRRALPKAAAHEAHKRGWLNFRLGFARLRDRRVSVLTKLAAVASGITLTAILVAIEFPLETILAILIPFIGPVLDIAFDGFEIFVLPLLFTALIIRWLAPKAIVTSLQA